MVKQSSLDGLINQNSNGSFRTLLFVDGIIMTDWIKYDSWSRKDPNHNFFFKIIGIVIFTGKHGRSKVWVDRPNWKRNEEEGLGKKSKLKLKNILLKE